MRKASVSNTVGDVSGYKAGPHLYQLITFNLFIPHRLLSPCSSLTLLILAPELGPELIMPARRTEKQPSQWGTAAAVRIYQVWRRRAPPTLLPQQLH